MVRPWATGGAANWTRLPRLEFTQPRSRALLHDKVGAGHECGHARVKAGAAADPPAPNGTAGYLIKMRCAFRMTVVEG